MPQPVGTPKVLRSNERQRNPERMVGEKSGSYNNIFQELCIFLEE